MIDEPLTTPVCPHTWETNDAVLDHYDGVHHCVRSADHRLGVHICTCGTIDETR